MAFNLQVGIDSGGAVRGARTFNRSVDSMGRNADRQQRSLKRIETRMGGIGTAARNVQRTIVGLFTGLAIRQVSQYADAYTKLNNRIGLVTETGTEAAVIQRELFDLADRTRAPIEEIATLYGRAALSAQELGASQGELLRFTEGVAQALAVNGSSAQEARGALLQLSQALGSGVVRAEEFNSILEGARPVLTAVADGLGVTVAQLRGLVLEGEITSREFFDAVQSQLGNLESQFETTNATIGQAGTILNNAFIEATGTLASFSGASNGIVEIFRRLADFVRGPLVDGFIAFSVNLGEIITDFDNLFTAIKEVGSVFFDFVSDSIDDSEDYINSVGENLLSPWQTLRTVIEVATVEAISGFDRLATAFKALQANFADDRERAARLFGELEDKEAARLKTINDILADREQRERRIADAQRSARATFSAEQRAEALAGFASAARAGSSGGGADTGDTEAAAKIQKQVDAFNEANNAAIKFQNTIAEIERLRAAGANQTAVDNALLEATTNFAAAQKEQRDALQDEVQSFNEANNAALGYKAALEEIARLEEAGADATAVQNAREAARQQFEQTGEQVQFLQELGKAAAQDIQGAFTDLFLSAGQGLDDFADKFGQTLQRLAANFLANQAIKFILNQAGNLGGPVGGFFSTLAGEFDSGGRIPRGQFGIVGEKGPEIVNGPANVTSRADTAAMMSPEVSLNIVNVSDPRAAVEATTNTNAGDKGVVNQIERNASDIKRVLGLS